MAESKVEECGSVKDMDSCQDNTEKFYTNAAKYWENAPSTVDGMLGGFGRLSRVDAIGSKKFLRSLLQSQESPQLRPGYALDCGAGIGRVSKAVLLPFFSQVDLLDQNPVFLEKAKTFLGLDSRRVEHYFAVGMQDFEPEEARYDLIWIQWCMGHLTDPDLVNFLVRCKKGLKPNAGLIVLKENVAFSHEDIYDPEDSSVTRSLTSILALVQEAGLEVVQEADQQDFPASIFKVKMLALKDSPNLDT